MSKQLSKEQVALLIQERIQQRLDEQQLAKAINEGVITEGIWSSLKNMIGGKDPEHSKKISGTLKRSLDQAANKTVKKMFDQFEQDYPGFPNIKDSAKFEKGTTTLALMYQSVKDSAIHGQMPVEVANAIIITLKQYTEALLKDLSRTYKVFKEEEEIPEALSSGQKGALGGAAAATTAMAPGAVLGGAASGISSAATGYAGLLAGAAQGAGGIASWIGGSAMTAGGVLGALGAIGAPLAVGAGVVMLGKYLFGSSRKGMLKKLVKMLDPVDPAQAAPYSGERAQMASSVAQSVSQGNFKAANQGYTQMQTTYAQDGAQRLQQNPEVAQQVGGALESAIGAENAAAFVAVASGEQSIEDLPQLQQDIISAVLGQFQSGELEDNIEDAIEVAESATELEEERESLEDEGELGDAESDPTGGGEDLPQETPISINNSNAEQEEPLVAVIQDLGLPQDAAASIATKMVDYLNQRQIPVSEGNLRRLSAKFARRLTELTDAEKKAQEDEAWRQHRAQQGAPEQAAAPPGDGDPSGPNRAAQQAMAQRAAGEPEGEAAATPQEKSLGDKTELVLDAAQLLGMTGFGAALATPAALASLVLHASRGEWGKATIDLIAALPIAGSYFKGIVSAGKAGKLAKGLTGAARAIESAKNTTAMAKAVQNAASVENLTAAGVAQLPAEQQRELRDQLLSASKVLEKAGMPDIALKVNAWAKKNLDAIEVLRRATAAANPESDGADTEAPPSPEDPEARARGGQSVEAGARARAKLEAGNSAIGKILVRAFEQAPEGDPLKSEEAIAVFSDPERLKALFDEVGLALRIQLQKRQYAPKQIDAILEQLLRNAILAEQANHRLDRWKQLANI